MKKNGRLGAPLDHKFGQSENFEAPFFDTPPNSKSNASEKLEEAGLDLPALGPETFDPLEDLAGPFEGMPSEDRSPLTDLPIAQGLGASHDSLPEAAATAISAKPAGRDDAELPAPPDHVIESVLSNLPSAVPEWSGTGGFELVEHHHTCGCIACSNDRDESEDAAGDATGGETSGSLGILSDMSDFLLTGYWNTGYGDGTRSHNVTNSGADANNGVLHYNLSGYSADADGITGARAELVREAFKLFESTLGIQFEETTSTDTSVVDFFFRDNASGAYASHSYWNSGAWGSTITYAQINVAASWSGGTSTYDDYTFQTILHEIGHALGLGHQGPYNGSASYGTDNVFDNDNWQSSMMSYFSQTQATAVDASYEFLQTPMVVDWMALDTIYGRQGYGTDNAFTEDTTWGFNTTITSDVSDVWATWSDWGNRTASTIVDSGGIDTLDLSGYSNNTLINLAPSDPGATSPSSSDIGGRIGNLTISTGTIIENAIGGAGSETFYGNVANNTLVGNGGDDTFHDSAGSDTYIGGAGNDFVVFGASFADFTYSLLDGFLQVIDAAIDWIDSTVEWLTFSDQTLSWQAVADSAVDNAAPTANEDTIAVTEDVVLNGTGLLSNDTDPDGDTLSVASVEGVAVDGDGTTVTLASGAVVTVYADGTFDYDQNGAFDGLQDGQQATDSFVYRATDGLAQSGDATVTITINGVSDGSNPVAVADTYSIGEDVTLNGSGLLDNDTDADGDALSVARVEGVAVNAGGTTVTLASGATVIMYADGTFFYDQNGAFDALDVGEQATDSFVYSATDGNSESSETTVTVTINGAFDNSGPVAGNDSFSLDENGTVSGSVLSNDTDADGDALTVIALNGSSAQVGVAQVLASGATVTVNADGTFSYDTNGAFDDLEDGETATDTFAYTISDGQGGTDTAQVTMNIDGVSPPVASETVVIDFEGEATGAYAGDHGLVFDGLNVSASGALSGSRAGSAGSDGDFTISAGGEDFDLNSLSLIGLSGRQKVLFQAYDDGVLVASLQVNVSARKATNVSFDSTFDSVDQIVVTGSTDYFVDNISLVTRMPIDPDGNFAPIAVNDVANTSESATVAGNLLANDSDPNGDALTLVSVEGDESGTVQLASGATVTYSVDGGYVYDPNGAFDSLYDGQSATDSFIYVVSDGNGGFAQATASITIAGQGTPPTPTTVDFENASAIDAATVTDDGFMFSNAGLTTSDPGVSSGTFALTDLGGAVTLSREDGESFDFESGVFALAGRGRETLTIEGYLDGQLIGSESFNLRANRENTVQTSDAIFDMVDEVVLTSSSGLTMDDLVFLA